MVQREVMGNPLEVSWAGKQQGESLAALGRTGHRKEQWQTRRLFIEQRVHYLKPSMRQYNKKSLPFMMMFSLTTSEMQRHLALDTGTHQGAPK